MRVQRNLARTMQLARPVLQTEITNVCAFPDLLAITVKRVRNIVINSTSSYNKESQTQDQVSRHRLFKVE